MSFGLSVSDTIQAGLPVAEQLTTKYSDGSTQTESLLKVPNPANNTVTTYETINLRNNGGTETVVDTESFSGGTDSLLGQRQHPHDHDDPAQRLDRDRDLSRRHHGQQDGHQRHDR